MSRRLPLFLSLAFFLLSSCSASAGEGDWTPRTGDIVFQESTSGQSTAIAAATGSRWTHVGVVFVEGGSAWVFEGVQPVGVSLLDRWVVSGKGGDVVVKRLKEADELLSPEVLKRMAAVRKDLTGKDYDLLFGWSDEEIYCSELVWKLFDRAAGLQLGKLEKLRDFELGHPVVQAKLKERYGDAVPLDETVISPGSLFEDRRLRTVHRR